MATPVKQEHGWGLSLFIGAWIFSVESAEFIRYLESWLCLCHCQGCNPACGELPTCPNSVKQLWNKSVTTTRNCETTTLFFQYYNHEFAGTPRYTDSYDPSPLFNPIQGNVWKCMELLCAHPRKTSAGTRQNLQMSSARSLHWAPGNIVQSLAPA